MPKFHGNATVYGGKYLGEVEAETVAEAVEKLSEELGTINLCRQCSGECEDGSAEDLIVSDDGGNVVYEEKEPAPPAFRPAAITDRLALITSGAKWGGRGPNYGAKEKAVIAALTGIANDHGWVVTYDADKAAWSAAQLTT